MDVVKLEKSFGARTVLSDVSFALRPGDRLAVVGRNGEGKSTLLRILAGQLAADGGQLSVPRGHHVALHDQRPPTDALDRSLEDYVGEGMAAAQAAEARLAALEARMAGGDSGAEVLEQYTRAQSALERAGGYDWRVWMGRVTRGLGIPDDRLGDPLSVFSGGELTRASLARALVSRPDVLLLDEPTNHLDVTSTEWLEQAVIEMRCAVVLVSHDRWFLESVATGVLELDRGRSKLWPMGYSRFRQARAEALALQAKEAERSAAEIARLERFVTRWRAGTKARQAQSRAKALAKIERVSAPSSRRSVDFGFPPVTQPGRVVLEAEGVTVSVADRTLLDGVDLAIERGQRVALVGPNGTGKTTLLDTLTGARRPAKGRVGVGHRVEANYYSQHGNEMHEDRSVVDTLMAAATLTRTQARTLLGTFLFSGAEVEKIVADLSGGERRRLSLAIMVAQGGNFLILDEPTNHLDAESREALEDALRAYEGTILFVSHDRALIDAIATRTLSIEDGGLVAREGGWAELLRARRLEADDTVERPSEATRQSSKRAPASGGKGAKASRSTSGAKRVRQLEVKVTRLEQQLADIEAELGKPDVHAEPDVLAELGAQHRDVQEDLAYAMAEWERAAEAAEA
ncbi:MAG: ABC-F family ATP-binding cassette domain-containing protein [Thermoleophilia bacterium]